MSDNRYTIKRSPSGWAVHDTSITLLGIPNLHPRAAGTKPHFKREDAEAEAESLEHADDDDFVVEAKKEAE